MRRFSKPSWCFTCFGFLAIKITRQRHETFKGCIHTSFVYRIWICVKATYRVTVFWRSRLTHQTWKKWMTCRKSVLNCAYRDKDIQISFKNTPPVTSETLFQHIHACNFRLSPLINASKIITIIIVTRPIQPENELSVHFKFFSFLCACRSTLKFR